MGLRTSQSGGNALRKVTVHIRNDEVCDGVAFTEMPCRDRTDRSGPD